MNKQLTVSVLANQVKQKIQSFPIPIPILIQGKSEEMKMKIRQEISQVFH